MKQLTEQEIKFIKETGWTPTVYQCDEWYKTIWTDEHLEIGPESTYKERKEAYSAKYEELAFNTAKKYGVDLGKLYKKCTDNSDSISLEYEATYLFYILFTKEELELLTDEEATEFLKNFQYYLGYRKWDGGNLQYVQEALEVYNRTRVFYLENDSDVWNIEADSSWLKDNKNKILKIQEKRYAKFITTVLKDKKIIFIPYNILLRT